MIWRIVGNVIGGALFIVGIPLAISPIPIGLIVLFIAIVILVASNPYVASLVRLIRRKSKTIDGFFHKAEDVLPEPIAEPLHETDDDEENHAARAASPPMMRRVNIPRRLR